MFDFFQNIGKPETPVQHWPPAVSVEVGVILQQILGKDVIGHHGEVKLALTVFTRGVHIVPQDLRFFLIVVTYVFPVPFYGAC